MGNILMEKINFIYEYETDGVIFPNGLTEAAYHSTLQQIELRGISTSEFFGRGFTDHHNVINLSSEYKDILFNIFYTRTIRENILESLLVPILLLTLPNTEWSGVLAVRSN